MAENKWVTWGDFTPKSVELLGLLLLTDGRDLLCRSFLLIFVANFNCYAYILHIKPGASAYGENFTSFAVVQTR